MDRIKKLFDGNSKELNLSYYDLGAEGAKSLSEALKVNTVLTNIDLRSNNIGDEGAKSLSSALKVNTVITTIDLGFNNIGKEFRMNSEPFRGAEELRQINERLKINKVNKDRLKGLKFLCANKLKQLGKAEEVKALISSVIYDECFCL